MTLECKNCGKEFKGNFQANIVLSSCPSCPGARDEKLHVNITDETDRPAGWHEMAKLMDEIQVRLNEAWYMFCRLKGMVVPDPPDLKEPKPGE